MNKYRILATLAGAVSIFASGCNGALTGEASNTDQVSAITIARTLRVYQGLMKTVTATMTAGVNATTQYDGNLYWYKSAVSGAVTTITYSTDQAGNITVGTATVTDTTTGGSSTKIYSVVLAINNSVAASTRPETGTYILTITSGAASINTSGTISLNSASGATSVAINLTEASGAVTGSLSTTGGVAGTPVSLTSITGTVASGIYTLAGTSTVLDSTLTFNDTLGVNGSGSLTLSDNTALTWGSNGTAQLQIPNVNGTINIANVDDGE